MLLFQLKSAIQDFLKSRGYEADRLAYMLLSSIKNLPYVDPYVVYDMDLSSLTDEELEALWEEGEQITFNALISSIIEQLKWMSDGPFIL